MHALLTRPWWRDGRWTLGLAALLLVVNVGLFPGMPAACDRWTTLLEYDRQAVLGGQVWRLLTGNLVHWSAEHFLLDAAALVIIGILYERSLGRRYPWLLLGTGLSVGIALLVLRPETAIYRGLSGLDSGLFAAAMAVELKDLRRQPERWVWVVPAVTIFAIKIVYESATGTLFFGTESLGNLGLPTPLSHAAGSLAGLALAPWGGRRWPRQVFLDLLSRFKSRGKAGLRGAYSCQTP